MCCLCCLNVRCSSSSSTLATVAAENLRRSTETQQVSLLVFGRHWGSGPHGLCLSEPHLAECHTNSLLCSQCKPYIAVLCRQEESAHVVVWKVLGV
jgi:hypothetical protein